MWVSINIRVNFAMHPTLFVFGCYTQVLAVINIAIINYVYNNHTRVLTGVAYK